MESISFRNFAQQSRRVRKVVVRVPYSGMAANYFGGAKRPTHRSRALSSYGYLARSDRFQWTKPLHCLARSYLIVDLFWGSAIDSAGVNRPIAPMQLIR